MQHTRLCLRGGFAAAELPTYIKKRDHVLTEEQSSQEQVAAIVLTGAG